MASVIIPAHNEERVIRRGLSAVLDGARPGELEVIVVCNGCSDATASIAREFGEDVRVIETDVPSKSNALNLGDEAATRYPRIYLDADVILDLASIRRLVEGLARPGVLAAAPRVHTVFTEDCDWAVRAFYNFWMALPFVREGMMAAGAYAMNETGRARFGRFPDVIADDGFCRLQFAPHERIEVSDSVSHVVAPARFSDLIKIRSRSRLGVHQLQARFPDLYAAERRSKRYRHTIAHMLMRVDLYPAAIPFIFVTVISRLRAGRQQRGIGQYVWERDNSSRL
jgi:cellulose synthase/poly-beta-1,6-N-acetylglucosamine synthase-like glycosyltransferase